MYVCDIDGNAAAKSKNMIAPVDEVRAAFHGRKLYVEDVLQDGPVPQKPLLLGADPWVENSFPTQSGGVRDERVVCVDNAQWASIAGFIHISMLRVVSRWLLP